MIIGLLMNSHEDDCLEEILAVNTKYVDCFYALDGTVPSDVSEMILFKYGRTSYMHDRDLPHPKYPEKPVCGWRQALLEMAIKDHGPDHWFVLLHGDEMLMFDPIEVIPQYPGADGFVVNLPFYFPKEGEPWDYQRTAIEQLHWRLGPGYPEFRMFKGSEGVHYDPHQSYNTRPIGLTNVVETTLEVRHYLYRSPGVQVDRAHRHLMTGFDPDNYRHILDGHVYWTDEMIAKYQAHPFYAELSS
jgi:hypothetical protein